MKLEKDENLSRWIQSQEVSAEIFQWDSGNSIKIKKHHVGKQEVEDIFLNPFVLGGKVIEPSHAEERWIIFGRTGDYRKLSLIFTLRNGKIRPISCRPMRKEERKIYEEAFEENSN